MSVERWMGKERTRGNMVSLFELMEMREGLCLCVCRGGGAGGVGDKKQVFHS